jgi:hypothetical protein
MGPGALKSTQSAQTKVLGPAGLDTSRHRGLSKPVVPQVRQSQGVPRAVFLRFAPQGPRWTDPFRRPALLPERLSTAAGPTRGPVARGWRAGTHAAWTAGPPRRISSASVIPRPPLPAPRLKMLQTPLGDEAG